MAHIRNAVFTSRRINHPVCCKRTYELERVLEIRKCEQAHATFVVFVDFQKVVEIRLRLYPRDWLIRALMNCA